ncbi:MAG: hypothetical protein IJX27_06120 [Clostridia bacterium]|nr:hypothetical protein [Clostridia bacterium]
MQIYTEEKKGAVCVQGVSCAACRLLYPRIEGKEQISAFYEQTAENLLAFFREKAEAYSKSFKELDRREKRSFAPLRMNMLFNISYADENVISIVREYVLCEGKAILTYRKFGEIWSVESELLLPAKHFFPHKLWKTAEKEEFYFDGEAVLLENTFPHAAAREGRRIRLSDYIKETRFKV